MRQGIPSNSPETYKCFKCGKDIGDEEYVVNWGSCSECFSIEFDKALTERFSPRRKKLEDTVNRVILYLYRKLHLHKILI